MSNPELNPEIIKAIQDAQSVKDAMVAAQMVKTDVQADPDDLALTIKSHFGGKPFWRSKKFWASFFGAVLPIAIQAATGAVTWPVAAGMAAASGIAYVLAQGGVDKATADATGQAMQQVVAAKLAKKG